MNGYLIIVIYFTGSTSTELRTETFQHTNNTDTVSATTQNLSKKFLEQIYDS